MKSSIYVLVGLCVASSYGSNTTRDRSSSTVSDGWQPLPRHASSSGTTNHRLLHRRLQPYDNLPQEGVEVVTMGNDIPTDRPTSASSTLLERIRAAQAIRRGTWVPAPTPVVPLSDPRRDTDGTLFDQVCA